MQRHRSTYYFVSVLMARHIALQSLIWRTKLSYLGLLLLLSLSLSRHHSIASEHTTHPETKRKKRETQQFDDGKLDGLQTRSTRLTAIGRTKNNETFSITSNFECINISFGFLFFLSPLFVLNEENCFTACKVRKKEIPLFFLRFIFVFFLLRCSSHRFYLRSNISD